MLRRPLSFWREAQALPAVKVVGSGLRKCLQAVKTLIKKKGGVYFCDPVSFACCRARAAYPQPGGTRRRRGGHVRADSRSSGRDVRRTGWTYMCVCVCVCVCLCALAFVVLRSIP